MPKTTTVQVNGLRELGESMRLLSADVATRIARAATAAGAQVIRKEAVRLAPQSSEPHQLGRRKDQIVQPGNLKRNIIIKRMPKSSLSSEHIVTVRHGSGQAPKDAFYGSFVEFGTAKMPAQPFLRPAFESQKEAAVEQIAKRIKARIDRANKGSK